MASIKLDEFGGELPSWDARLLPPGQAALSENGYLFSGRLEGWRKPKLLRQLTSASARFVYRLPALQERQAIAYCVFLANPVSGDTISIGDFTYTFKAKSGIIDPAENLTIGDVQLGNSIVDTLTNLIFAITADGGTNANAGILYGEDTVQNQDIKIYQDGQSLAEGLQGPEQGIVNIDGINYNYLVVGSSDFGEAYNSIPVAESTNQVKMIWLYNLLAITNTTETLKGGLNRTFDNRVTGNSEWLEFDDPDTNVLKSQVADDTWQRYYAASPSLPPKYNPINRILAGLPFWNLGVPPPGCAPNLGVAGGGNDLTLGRPDSGGGEFVGAANYIYLIPITTPGPTALQNMQFLASPNQSFQPTDDFFTAFEGDVLDGHFCGVIYQDDNGAPGGLIATGEVVTGISALNINVSTFQNPVTLTGETGYWIGIMSDSAFKYAATFGSITEMVGVENTFSNGPPGDFPTGDSTYETGLFTINMWGEAETQDVVEGRSYVYTWVSAYGEEGPPSPASLLNGWSNGRWTIGLWEPPANDQGILRNLTNINIYRTVVSTGGIATFFFVDTVPIGTVEYLDTKPGSEVSLNTQLPSTNWFPPPENLQGIVSMPNGMMAGFASNQVWFSEPYHPHAWPPGYVLTTEFPIIGLGVSNGSLVVCTATVPYVVQGVNPGSMTLTKCDLPYPCSSRGSIVAGTKHVTYHSPNGLIQVKPDGTVMNTTDRWFTREQWQGKTPQHDCRAVQLASCYFAFGSVSRPEVSPVDTSEAQRGFTIELDEEGESFTIWPQPGGHRLGFNALTSPLEWDIDNVVLDVWTGTGLLVGDGSVWYYDFGDADPDLTTYTWKSKIYQPNTRKSFEAMKVFFTVPSTQEPLNEFIYEQPATDVVWESALPADRYGFLKTYADVDDDGEMILVDCREIRKSGQVLRIVSGFKADNWQFEIVGRVAISNVQIATTVKELGGT
jgi:hypothetical protein